MDSRVHRHAAARLRRSLPRYVRRRKSPGLVDELVNKSTLKLTATASGCAVPSSPDPGPGTFVARTRGESSAHGLVSRHVARRAPTTATTNSEWPTNLPENPTPTVGWFAYLGRLSRGKAKRVRPNPTGRIGLQISQIGRAHV